MNNLPLKKITVSLLLTFLLISPLKVSASMGLIKPGSRTYFLQSFGESVRYLFTFTKKGKINYLLNLTDRRVDEINANNANPDLIKKLTNKYQKNYSSLEKLSAKTNNDIEVSAIITQNNLRQQQVLADVYQKAPEAAQTGIINAQENSSQNVSNIITRSEGADAARLYREKVAIMQQVGKVKIMPMESGGPAPDPSQTPLNPLRDLNSTNPLNPTDNVSGGNVTSPVTPVAPQPMR